MKAFKFLIILLFFKCTHIFADEVTDPEMHVYSANNFVYVSIINTTEETIIFDKKSRFSPSDCQMWDQNDILLFNNVKVNAPLITNIVTLLSDQHFGSRIRFSNFIFQFGIKKSGDYKIQCQYPTYLFSKDSPSKIILSNKILININDSSIKLWDKLEPFMKNR